MCMPSQCAGLREQLNGRMNERLNCLFLPPLPPRYQLCSRAGGNHRASLVQASTLPGVRRVSWQFLNKCMRE